MVKVEINMSSKEFLDKLEVTLPFVENDNSSFIKNLVIEHMALAVAGYNLEDISQNVNDISNSFFEDYRQLIIEKLSQDHELVNRIAKLQNEDIDSLPIESKIRLLEQFPGQDLIAILLNAEIKNQSDGE